MGLRSGTSSYGLGGNGTALDEAVVTLEDIKNSASIDIPKGADAIEICEEDLAAMPLAQQPFQLKSALLPYQLQGLAWMTSKETQKIPEKVVNRPVQLWRRNAHGNYWNLASGFVCQSPTKLCSGGILADDMGLGKTLQVISMILTDGPGPTLIISPVSVMSNWKQQIERHVRVDQMPKVLVYHGNKKMKVKDLTEYDVIITSYGRVAREQDPKASRVLLDGSVTWRRVVLDEGHAIRNARTKVALAVCQIQAKSRWILTGTPIINSVKDLHSLVKFLHLTGGIEQAEIFNANVTRKLASGDGRGEAILQALIQDICLRRRKDMKFVDLKLPEKKEYLHKISFYPSEKQKYDALLSEAHGALEEFQENSNAGQKGRFQNVLERLLRLRQTCNHWTLCKERIDDLMKLLEDEKVVSSMRKTGNSYKKRFGSIWRVKKTAPSVMICQRVRSSLIASTSSVDCVSAKPFRFSTSAQCVVTLSQRKAFWNRLPRVLRTKMWTWTVSSKTEALLQIVQATLRNAGSKVVVFSQWTSFLNIVQNQLVKAGINFSRLDGSMNAEKRDLAIEALDRDADTRVFLASLAVCSVDLNLVSADTVILSDSWWVPAIEDQAIDRVHRLGQTHKTTIWRLMMENSVEERVLTIQSQKRELFSTAFQEKKQSKQKAKETRLNDVLRLLS